MEWQLSETGILVKIIGMLCLLFAGYETSVQIMLPKWERYRYLQEGLILYQRVQSEIENNKTPLPDLFEKISKTSKTKWGDFFLNFSAI